MFVSCDCCVCQIEVSEMGRSLVQRSPTDCGVLLCVMNLIDLALDRDRWRAFVNAVVNL